MAALGFPPNPCISPLFQPPLYALSNVSATKAFIHPELDNTWDDWFDGDLKFTLTDVANNYSLACHWAGTERYKGLEDWKKESCLYKSPNGTLVIPPVETRIVTLLNLDRLSLFRNHSLEQPVSIAQYWYCDIGSDHHYPEAYQARANFSLEISCPGRPANSTDGRPLACAEKLPTDGKPIMANMKSLWQPRGVPYPGTPQLVPSPSPLPSVQGLSPPPERDCSYSSFLYPYWTVDNLEYKQPLDTDLWNTADGYLDLNLTSRVTGSRVRCRWGSGIGHTDVDRIALSVCAPAGSFSGNSTDNSRSTFDVRFNLRNKELTIGHNWTCGDTTGRFSTDFRAEGGILSPTICSSSEPICRAAQFRVDGHITKPFSLYPPTLSLPQGASNADCLTKSRPDQRPRGTVWTLSRFLWQATTYQITNSPYDFGLTPYPVPNNQTLRFTLYNEAINLTFSCDFNDQSLQNYTDQWFPCFSGGRDPHDRGSSVSRHRVETYLQWNSQYNQLAFNQTWYCTIPATRDNPRGIAYKISGHNTIWPPYSLYCGSSTSTWNNARCPRMIWSPEAAVCDVTYRAKWCTIGDAQGNRDPDGLYLNPQDLTIDRLPANELVEPELKPDQWSCTVSSATRPVVWSLRHSARGGPIPNSFLTKTVWWDPANRQTWDRDTAPTYFMMDLVSSVWAGRKGPPAGGLVKEIGLFDEQISRRQTPWTKGFDPIAWYDLKSEPAYFRDLDYDFYNPREWSYCLDLSSPKGAYLELKHSWYCDDLNLDTPIIFNGTWSGYLPLNCTYEFPGPMNKEGTEKMESGIYCRLPGGEISVRPNVTAMTYHGKLFP